eukprot:6213792-Pleurochrysis_carterae.AAC.2
MMYTPSLSSAAGAGCSDELCQLRNFGGFRWSGCGLESRLDSRPFAPWRTLPLVLSWSSVLLLE